MLAQEGFGLVKIDNLVVQMGVTKGSFYWHFINRNQFLEELVAYWDKQYTRSVMEYVTHLSGHPGELLLSLMRYVTERQLARYDDVFHALAQSEPSVTSAIREVNQSRIEFVASILLEMGFTPVEAEVRSKMMVAYMSYEQIKTTDQSASKQQELVTEAHRLVTGVIKE